MNLAQHIGEQAKVVNVRPTDGQKTAGNYRKGHIKVHGLDITIENPRGSYRSGRDPETGKPWRSRLPHHYGYVRRTEGGDGDHVDVYLGPHLKSPHVYVIDQRDLRAGDWDEHKIMLGFGSEQQARAAYAKAFSDGRGKDRISHVEHMSIEGLKDWLRDGNTKAPIKRAAGGKVRAEKALPANHQLGMRVPKGGSSCAKCKFLASPTTCGNRGFIQWNGGSKLPAPADQYCCDLYEVARKRFAEGGAVHMADGGAPPFEQTSDVPSFDQTQPVVDNGRLDATLRGAAQGATFNFADEIAGAHAAAPKIPGTDMDIPELVGPIPARTLAGAARVGINAMRGEPTPEYDKARDEFRAADEAAKAAHPYYHGAGELAGAIPAMAATPELGAARALAPTAGRLAKFGAGALDAATTGGIYGGVSGAGEGTDAGSRALESAKGIVSGIVGGGIAHGASEIARAAYERFGKPVTGAIQGWLNPEGEASRRLAAALKTDQEMIQQGTAQGMAPQDWAAARQRGEPVTLADLGSTRTQALLRSAANTSPEGRAMLENTFEGRFLGQSERVGDTVRGLVPGGANARKSGDQLVAEYDAGRVPAYKQAYAAGDKPIMTAAMERLMGSDTFVGAMKRAISSGKDRDVAQGLGGFNPMVNVTPDGRIVFNKGAQGVPTYPNLQYWDQVKRELDSVANQAKRSGDTTSVAGDLSRVLRGELDSQVPSYSAARGVAEQYFGESNALEAGRKLAGKRADPNDVAMAMKKMKPDERSLFQEGYASDLADRVIGNIRDTRDLTKAIFATPNERQMISTIFGPGGVQHIQNRMALETIMNGARNAMGNSTTARQLIEAGLAGGALSGYASGWDPMKTLEGAAGGAGARFGAGKLLAGEVATGARHLIGRVDSATARRVAELLTSDDPRLLREGYQMAAKNESIGKGLRAIATKVALAGQAQTRPMSQVTLRSLQGPVAGHADQEQQQPVGVGNQ
jgi:hypothetical protein